MPLGTEVGLGLRDIVFYVDSAAPSFQPTSIVATVAHHSYC